MLLENNPFTTELHKDWRKRIECNFAEIDFSNSSDYLSIINYIDKTPHKFYFREAFQKYIKFLEKVKLEEPRLLASILSESESVLSLSNKILNEINNEQIHDIVLSNQNNDLIGFIDKNINYNLLKIYEAPFFHLSYIIAKHSWAKNKKGIEGLDLSNSVKELIELGLSFVESVYLHTVRNGIAHGKIEYTESDITYIDKKGNKEKTTTKKIIKTFDQVLDISNGFCLALKVFYFTNPDFIKKFKISIPQSILIEELQAKANAPAWTITNCLESIALQNKRQLNIYIKNDFWDFKKVQYCSFNTAYCAEKLTKCYDRIFFSYYSVHNKLTPTGWAAFDAKIMREIRENDKTEIDNYFNVLEEKFVFFDPKIKFPRFIYFIGFMKAIFKSTFPIIWKKIINKYFPKPFIIRDTSIRSNGFYAIITNASLIIKNEFQNDIEKTIKQNKKKIIKKTIKYSKKQCNHLSIIKYLPVRYIKICLYDTDLRIRNLRNSGFIPELIGTIEVNRSKNIDKNDIFNGTPEQIGKYRIVWYNNWQGKKD